MYDVQDRISGGPATKFIYYIIKNKHPIDQTELINITLLPRRTVQNAIDELIEQQVIAEKLGSEDARKRIYYPV